MLAKFGSSSLIGLTLRPNACFGQRRFFRTAKVSKRAATQANQYTSRSFPNATAPSYPAARISSSIAAGFDDQINS